MSKLVDEASIELYCQLVCPNILMSYSNCAWDIDKDQSHLWIDFEYRKVWNTLVGNKIVDHSDVVGASPVGAAPTTSSFST